MERLWAVIGRLALEEPLEQHHRKHRLTGNWSGSWECHIEPDWLLIWDQDGDGLRMVRTGTHADLFG